MCRACCLVGMEEVGRTLWCNPRCIGISTAAGKSGQFSMLQRTFVDDVCSLRKLDLARRKEVMGELCVP
jgi:hypothetical protein